MKKEEAITYLLHCNIAILPKGNINDWRALICHSPSEVTYTKFLQKGIEVFTEGYEKR